MCATYWTLIERRGWYGEKWDGVGRLCDGRCAVEVVVPGASPGARVSKRWIYEPIGRYRQWAMSTGAQLPLATFLQAHHHAMWSKRSSVS